MKSRFDIVYENVMKTVITEAWDRWYIWDIAIATKAMTNDFTDEWVKR